jgi:nicotinate-nucleotide--dimethylbenzimidazole phosphoribosyltransferase
MAEVDEKVGHQVRAYLDTLTKPPGSLGRLEDLAVQLAEMTGEPFPVVSPPGVIVFAADHGVTEEGVSAFPQEVTIQMVNNFLAGGAAINVLSRSIGAKLKIVDVGVAGDVKGDRLVNRKVSRGTKNFCKQDAMTRSEAIQAIEAGQQETKKMIEEDGIKCLIPGEMGIGNTTASSAVLAALTGAPVESLIGGGTGVDTEKLKHKQQVIEKALNERKPDRNDPIEILAKVGGLEMAAIAGAVSAAAARRVPVLLDGFICTTAALAAAKIHSHIAEYLIVGHRSAEPGHDVAIRALNKQPLLDLGLRLGEGSGAAVAFPILESAMKILKEMATFESAGVSGKSQ